MASYNELNALIDAYINRNGVQAITGQILNGVLKAMVEQIGRGYAIMGVADPTTDPWTPDAPESWFAYEPGTYTLFDGITVAPGEFVLLEYRPNIGWRKEILYDGFQTVDATIDGNVGTPSVGVSYADGVLSFDFHNMKGNPGQNGQDGQDGDPAGFGTIGADITGGVGTPGVSVESSGPATAKNLQFHFTNLKGETGVTSVVVTVDNTTGTPTCTASLSGGVLTLAFTGLKGAQGNPGSSVDYPFTLVNNLTTNDPDQALSAAMGVQLESEISQLEAEVIDLDNVLVIGTNSETLSYTGTVTSVRISSTGEIVGGMAASYVIYYYTAAQKTKLHISETISGPTNEVGLFGYVDAVADIVAGTTISGKDGIFTNNGTFTGDIVIPAGKVFVISTQTSKATCTVNLLSAYSSRLDELDAKVDKVPIPITGTGMKINTNGAIGSTLPAPSTSASFNYMKFPVVAGDIVYVNAKGGSSPLAWCFADSDDKILSQAEYSTSIISATLVAPTNSAWVVINDQSGSTSYWSPKDSILAKMENIKVAKTDDSGFVKTTITDGSSNSESIITKVGDVKMYIPNPDISSVAIYEGCIAELWLNQLVFSFNAISFSQWNSGAYLYLKNTENDLPIATAATDVTDVVNGDIVPIYVTTAGGGLNVGDFLGYVIFKDITTFKATTYTGSKCYINRNRALSLDYNRKIWYGKMVSKEYVETIVENALSTDLEVVLPSVIYAAVGVQLNIYNDTIALSMDKGLISPTNYIVEWICAKGTVTSRAFRFTPVIGDIGNVSLTCNVFNVAGTVIATKTVTIKVVSASIASSKRVVFFGDSTGSGSATALNDDFADSGLFSGVAPTMLGLKGTTTKYEGFGGARWADFATQGRQAYRCQVSGVGPIALNSQYTNNGFTWTVVEVNVTEGTGNILITKNDLYPSADAPETNGTLVPVGSGDSIPYTSATATAGNPLWYNGDIDFAHYRSTLGLGAAEKFDLVSFQLGLNGTATISAIRENIEDIYAAAIADNPSCIILLGLVTGPANTVDAYGVNYGAGDWMSNIKRYHERRKLYVEMAESGDYPNLRVAVPNLCIDRYYGFPIGTRQISSRYSETEEYHTNYVHPSASGYAQIGDAFFSAYIATLNE